MVITIIVGSPRDKGSSSRIADSIIEGIRRDDCFSGTIHTHCLGNINIEYCKGCKSCYANGTCVISDDFQMVFDHIIESDGLVIISPSYWGDITGQLKVFFDRSTPFCDTNPQRHYPEKKRWGISVAIRTGMNEAENQHIMDTIEHYFSHLAIEPIDRLSVCGVETPSDLMKHEDALVRALKLGVNMRAYLEQNMCARITVRKGSEDDIKDVFDMYTEAIDWLDSQGIHQWQHGIYPTEDTARLAFKNDSLFVVEEPETGKPIGTMIINEYQSEEYQTIQWTDISGRPLVLHTLIVRPSVMGQGYAREMMQYVFQYARKNGYSSIRLDAFPGNEAAIGLYTSLGFKKVGQVSFELKKADYKDYDCFEIEV